jgi:hypothetical protein
MVTHAEQLRDPGTKRNRSLRLPCTLSGVNLRIRDRRRGVHGGLRLTSERATEAALAHRPLGQHQVDRILSKGDAS